MLRKIHRFLRWAFPPVPDRRVWEPRLAEFYRSRRDYHAMTGADGKTVHPQVRLLQCLIRSGGTYAEIGCGSGSVCRLIGTQARVHGIDVSPVAIEQARRLDGNVGNVYECASGDRLPLPDSSVDGVYSFEVLEHVWDPVAVAREMVRITKPGAFLLISAPNPFSPDLHLRKKPAARAADIAVAAGWRAWHAMTGRVFRNVEPRLTGPVYPDCDMVTAIVPSNFARALRRMGCSVDFWDTAYMCAHRPGSRTDLNFQKRASAPFLRHLGDHLLLLAHKRGQTGPGA